MTDLNLSLSAPVSTLFSSTSSTLGNTLGGLGVNSNSLTISSGGTNLNSIPAINYVGYYWPYYEPYKEYHYHHWNAVPKPDKFETAFKMARKLMEKKLVKPLKTVEDFFKLMDSIVEVL